MSKNSSNLFYLGVFLCVVCAAAAGIMGSAAALTREPIEGAKVKKVADGLREVLPAFDNDPMKDSAQVGDVLFYHAEKDGKTVGYAARTSVSSGYGGRIEALISFQPDGAVRTFIVTGHSETPGLGSQAVDRVRKRTLAGLIRGEKEPEGLPPNKILDQYVGHSGAEAVKDTWKRPWKLQKDGGNAEHVTGATISSRAVNELAWKAASAFEAYQAARKEGKSK